MTGDKAIQATEVPDRTKTSHILLYTVVGWGVLDTLAAGLGSQLLHGAGSQRCAFKMQELVSNLLLQQVLLLALEA